MEPLFEGVLPHLAPVLLDPVARDRLSTLTQTLPVFEAGCLEFRLAATDPQVDFSVPIRELPVLPRRWLQTLPWQAVEALCRRRQRSDASDQWDYLEFDLDAAPAPMPHPRLFIAPGSLSPSGFTAEGVLEVLRLLHRRLPETTDGLQTCLDALPPGGSLCLIGTLASARPLVRVVIELPPSAATPSGVLRYLHAIGSEAAAERLAPVVRRLGAPTSWINLNVGERIEARVDVEFRLSNPSLAPGRAQQVFEALVELELANRAKCEALMAWPGATRVHAVQTASGLVDRLIGQAAWFVVTRKLTHVKVCAYASAPLQAKAYAHFVRHDFSV